jgi:hypothetical protein
MPEPRESQVPTASDAHQRALSDYAEYGQHVRAAVQFSFAANGAALLAMASYLTAIITTDKLHESVDIADVVQKCSHASWFFLGGLTASFLSMILFALSKISSGDFWEDVALSGYRGLDSFYAKRADVLHKLGYLALSVGAACLIPGGAFLIAAFN